MESTEKQRTGIARPSDAAAETSFEMHRHSGGQLRHGIAMTAEEKRWKSKERPYADLQRLGKAERWQGYVRHGLAALRNGTDSQLKAKAMRCSEMRRNGKATKHDAMDLHSEAMRSIGMDTLCAAMDMQCEAVQRNCDATHRDARCKGAAQHGHE